MHRTGSPSSSHRQISEHGRQPGKQPLPTRLGAPRTSGARQQVVHQQHFWRRREQVDAGQKPDQILSCKGRAGEGG